MEAYDELEKASRSRRVFAFVIDHFLISFAAAISSFMVIGPNWDTNAQFVSSGLIILFAVVVAIYFGKDLVQGQSIGKRLLAIAVRKQNDLTSVPSSLMLIVRNLLIIIWPIEVIVLLLSKSKQRFGDRIADTVVVSLPTERRPRLILLLLLFALVISAFYLGTSVVIRMSSAYKTATEHIRQDSAVIEALGEVKGFGPLPMGSIQVVNGEGFADIAVKILGEDKSLLATIELTKQPGSNWIVKSLNLVSKK